MTATAIVYQHNIGPSKPNYPHLPYYSPNLAGEIEGGLKRLSTDLSRQLYKTKAEQDAHAIAFYNDNIKGFVDRCGFNRPDAIRNRTAKKIHHDIHLSKIGVQRDISLAIARDKTIATEPSKTATIFSKCVAKFLGYSSQLDSLLKKWVSWWNQKKG